MRLPGGAGIPEPTPSQCVSPQEAVQCVEELDVPGILPVFVQVGVESTLERSQITRDHMGQLLYQLVQSEKLTKQDFFKGWVAGRRAGLVGGGQLEVAEGRSRHPGGGPPRPQAFQGLAFVVQVCGHFGDGRGHGYRHPSHLAIPG